jgi:hypothetical protein
LTSINSPLKPARRGLRRATAPTANAIGRTDEGDGLPFVQLVEVAADMGSNNVTASDGRD